MKDISIADNIRPEGIVSFITGLFIAFLHADPRVITREERERGWASIQLLEYRRFERDFA
jgi:hypothetical protein